MINTQISMATNGLTRLILGAPYRYKVLHFAGWYVGNTPTTRTEGYTLESYFQLDPNDSQVGFYFGADQDGVEPLFHSSSVSKQQTHKAAVDALGIAMAALTQYLQSSDEDTLEGQMVGQVLAHQVKYTLQCWEASR